MEGVLEHIVCILLSELLLHLRCTVFWQDNLGLKIHVLNRNYFASHHYFSSLREFTDVYCVYTYILSARMYLCQLYLANCDSKLMECSGVFVFKNCKICCIYMTSSPIFYVGLTVKVIRLKCYINMQDDTVQKKSLFSMLRLSSFWHPECLKEFQLDTGFYAMCFLTFFYSSLFISKIITNFIIQPT